MNLKLSIVPVVFLLFGTSVYAQYRISGQQGTNPITVAAPFLGFAPDSRGSAMGDAGVATSSDVFSVHWNNAKLAFVENDMGISLSYSPWLGNIVDDMSLNYLTFYKKIDRIQAFGTTLRYFDLGEIYLTDISGVPQGIENPKEMAVDATYSRLLGDRFSTGLTMRFVWSNLAGNITGAPSARPGTSLAFDLGGLYRLPLVIKGMDSEWSAGAHISNIGQKITYSNEEFEDFIPGNLRLGTAFTTNVDPYNSFTFALDFNKLMVPTPPIYQKDADGNFVVDNNGDYVIESGKNPDRPFISGTFGSFTDAPGGFREELSEVSISTGIEYWYQHSFAIRMGYFYETKEKGDRKYFTTGLGFRYQIFGIDFSYLIPQQQNNPLADTLRLSLIFNFAQDEEALTF
ncbi:MAG: type IX secretion system outer membrane channel protein PorV [Cyclobacteriaceae bacterium]|nr:type IX secretion system outer membrane channel protein PorV [Cyclobacteriaceae bacterium]